MQAEDNSTDRGRIPCQGLGPGRPKGLASPLILDISSTSQRDGYLNMLEPGIIGPRV